VKSCVPLGATVVLLGEITIEMGGAVTEMVTVAVADLVGSATEVAVIVTVPPEGTVDGAVKIVAAPLAV
jgi:hypothetical protein